MADGKLHWCAFCGIRGTLQKVGQQKCGGTKRDQWLQKSMAKTMDNSDLDLCSPCSAPAATGHVRMLSGQVIWCDRCGAYGTHRGCGLARPCPGPAIMGSGGGSWQRLSLLRRGYHPKDKKWIGAPVPECAWSMATVSSINIAISETRKRDRILDQKVVAQPTSEQNMSRLQLVQQRIRRKELEATGRQSCENGCSDASSRTTCAGMPVSKLSRFEVMRLRIKAKEVSAMGESHVDG